MEVRHGQALTLCSAVELLLLVIAQPLTRPLNTPISTTSSLNLLYSTSFVSCNNAFHSSSNPTTTPAMSKTIFKNCRHNKGILVKDIYVGGFETSHPELCPKLGADVELLILVMSAPSHQQERKAIRLTWGHFAARNNVTLAFVLGTPPASFRRSIIEEDNFYNDVVIGRFIDSYFNLTLKTLSMLVWAHKHCPRVPIILKTDDDVFINVPRLLKFIKSNNRNGSKTIWGKVRKAESPNRNPFAKNYLSKEQYNPEVLPVFATGPAYLLTYDAAIAILKAAPNEPYIPLEDVFVTGVLGDKLKLTKLHSPEFYNTRVEFDPCVIQSGISIHMVQHYEQFELWGKLLDDKTICINGHSQNTGFNFDALEAIPKYILTRFLLRIINELWTNSSE